MKAPTKRFNVLTSPFLRRAGVGFVFLLGCTVALAWFAPPSAFAFFTGGENPPPSQTAVALVEKSGASEKASAPRWRQDGEKKSQDGVWSEIQLESLGGRVSENIPETARTLELNKKSLIKILNSAPDDSAERLTDLSKSDAILELPLPEGGFMRFRIADSPIMEDAMQEKFPGIKSYRGQSVDDSRVSARISFSPLGLHATILTHDKLISIHPARYDDVNLYVSYYGEDFRGAPFSCNATGGLPHATDEADNLYQDLYKDLIPEEDAPHIATGATLRKYRLAVATTQEYYNDPALGGGNTNNAQKDKAVASIHVWVNATNLIFEREMAVKFILVENTAASRDIIFTDPKEDDGLTNGNAGKMADEVEEILESKITLANFDIGHAFGKDGDGGVGGLGAVCAADKRKGRGATGLSSPLGNAASLAVFAHEIGHQFGAPHSFNSATECGGADGLNRSLLSAYEVGSGSTIMSYSNVCGSDNLVGSNDFRFHAISLKLMNEHINRSTQCAQPQATGNAAPVVDAGAGYTIPKDTPFALTASATDANDDVKTLTYTWEQFDNGGALYTNPPYGDQPNDPETTTRPIFRPYPATGNPTRLFPSLEYILNNANNPPLTVEVPWGSGTQTRQVGEKLPSVKRTLKFRVTARDNHSGGGGTGEDDVTLNVVSTAGPFAVTVPNTDAVVWTGGMQQNVTWDKSNTDSAPVSAANVRITLSTDGGQTFPYVLAASVPNSGSATVTVPEQIQTATARVKIEAIGNIFFDISDKNFTINNSAVCPTVSGIAPDTGNVGTVVTVTGTSFTSGMTVNFGGNITATTVNVINSTTLEATVPSNATSGAITISKGTCAPQQTAPFRVCTGSPQSMILDDNIQDDSYADNYHVNRLTPTSYPATLTHVQIYFHNGNNNATVGETFTILAGTNADGNTDINNTAFQNLPATVKTVGNFNTYALPAPITITQGDFVIGYKLTIARKGAADNTAPDSRSYYSSGGVGFTLTTSSDYMIRGQFTTNCAAAPTAPTISPDSQSFNASAGNGTIAVTASSAWMATTNAPWITIAPGASGTGGGTVVYAVKQNDTGATRTGTMTVAGQTFTVTQTACAIGFSPSPGTTLNAAGGNFEIGVFAPAGCSWTATSNTPSWITVTSGASGSNNGTIGYFVKANTETTPRTGTITIAGQTFTVTQNACPGSATMIFDEDADTGGNSSGYNVVRLTPTSYPATLTHAQIYFSNNWGTIGRAFEIVAGKNEDGDADITGSIQQTVPANSGTVRNEYVSFPLTTPITISSGDFVVGFKVAEAGGFFPQANENIAPTRGRSYWWNGTTFVNAMDVDYKIRGQYNSLCLDGTISPTSRSVGSEGATGTISVSIPGAWMATSNTPSWLTVTSGANGTDAGTVGYNVAVNPTQQARTGTITIAGQTFTVTQTACPAVNTMIFDEDVQNFNGGGTYWLQRLTPASYPATLTHAEIYLRNNFPANAAITILVGKNEDGDMNINSSVQQSFDVNTGTLRDAYTAFALQTPITISSGDFVVGFKVGQQYASLNVLSMEGVDPDRGRGYYSNDNGVTLVNDLPVDYKIRGRYNSFCPDGTISPSSQSFTGNGGSGTVNVTASGAWTAFSNDAWITITGGASGTGNGTVNYTVAQNTTGAARTGTLTIAGRVFTVTQDACGIVFAPSGTTTINTPGGTFTIAVTTPAGCAWTATSNAPWITFSSGESGSGSGTITYRVSRNEVPTTRTGTITISGQTLTVTQVGCPGTAETMIFDDEIHNSLRPATYNLVRLTPASYPAKLTHVQIYFHGDNRTTDTGVPYSLPHDTSVKILAGKNLDGDTNIRGSIEQEIPANSGRIRDNYTTFALPMPITITKGDFVVGFSFNSGIAAFPVAAETLEPHRGRGYESFNNGTTLNNITNGDFKIRGQYTADCPQGAISSSASPNFSNDGGSGTVSVTASGAWTAFSDDDWITITGGANRADNSTANYDGTGNGTVNYIVAPNNSGVARIGSMSIAGNVFNVKQGLGPTAASADISGRVLASEGRGVSNTLVVLTAPDGSVLYSRTNAFGYYRFDDVPAGQIYVVTAQNKRYRFAPRVLTLNQAIDGFNIIADS